MPIMDSNYLMNYQIVFTQLLIKSFALVTPLHHNTHSNLKLMTQFGLFRCRRVIFDVIELIYSYHSLDIFELLMVSVSKRGLILSIGDTLRFDYHVSSTKIFLENITWRIPTLNCSITFKTGRFSVMYSMTKHIYLYDFWPEFDFCLKFPSLE